MKNRLISAVLGAIFWSVVVVGAATADKIQIENASFENAHLAPGNWSDCIDVPCSDPDPDNWVDTPLNMDSAFSEHITDFVDDGFAHLGIVPGSTVYQDLSTDWSPNTVYQLTVAVGNRTEHTVVDNLSTYSLADSAGTIWATFSFDAEANVAPDSFADAPTLMYTTPAVGGPTGNIRIVLDALDEGRSHFDNVRLDATISSVTVVAPASFLTTRGEYVSGGLTELAASDNMDLALRRLNSDLQSRTEFEVKSTSPTATPTSFEFTLEGAVFARGNVVQTIELFDYVAGTWELVDTTDAARSPMPDKVVTATPTGDLSRFVEAGTMCMEARIHFQSDRNRQNFASNTDQAIWTIGQ